MMKKPLGWCGIQFGLGLLLCAVLAAPLRAQFTPLGGGLNAVGGSDDSEGALSLHAEFTAAAANQPAELKIIADIPAGWHTFSITQKRGGPNPTKLKLPESDQYRITGPFVADPPPKIENDPKIFDVPMEEHFGRVTWTAPLEIAKGVDPAKLEIRGTVNAQRCAAECLRPQDFSFVARLATATEATGGAAVAPTPAPSNPPSTPAPAPKAPVPASSGALPSGGTPVVPTTHAPADAGPAPQLGQFQSPLGHALLRGWIEPAEAAPGTVVKLIIAAEPAAGYHIYASAPNDLGTPVGNGKPTLIIVADGRFDRAAMAQADHPPTTVTGPVGAQQVYESPVEWAIAATVPQGIKPGEYPFSGLIGYHTCSGEKCDMPLGARFDGKVVVGAVTRAGTVSVEFRPAQYVNAAKLAATEHPAAVVTSRSGDNDKLGLPLIILCSLLGGLILNLMPCVLPVLGLKILSFVEQAGQSRARSLVLNIWYSAGLMLVFLVLATLEVAFGLAWGQQFQSAAFTITLTAVVFAMALSFLGVWEIPLPGFVGSGKAAELAAHEGTGGAFAKGALTTVLSTPCSGPYLGAVLAYSAKQPPHVAYLIFASMGLGMASPYLLIGAFPRLIRFLPKPGMWMETFKQVMAFFLLGTVAYLFSLLRQRSVYMAPTFGLLIAIWAGCWWIGRTPLTADFGRKLHSWLTGGAVAAALGVFSFWFFIPTQHWEPFSQTRLDQLTRQGKTVLVDFTADWCPTCKVNLRLAIDTPSVNEKMAANGVVPLVADWTLYSPEITEMLHQLDNSEAIPVLAIFPAGRPTEPIVLRDLLTERKVLDALDQAGPSRPASATVAAR